MSSDQSKQFIDSRITPEAPTRSLMWFLAGVLVLITFVAYWPGLQNEFLNWDDDANFLNNPNFKAISFEQIKWILTTRHYGVYQPVAWFLLCAQYSIAELKPAFYHLTSLLLHTLNALVFYFLALRILKLTYPPTFHLSLNKKKLPTNNVQSIDRGMIWGTAMASIFFSIHPLRVEAVTWISCQPYLPAAFFYMLGVRSYLIAYTEANDNSNKRRWHLLLVFVFYCLATMSKAAAISLPVLLLLLDAYPLKRLPDVNFPNRSWSYRWLGPACRRIWLEKWVYLIPLVAIAIQAVLAKQEHKTIVPLDHYSIVQRLAHVGYSFCFYLFKTIIPWNLSPYYVLPKQVSILDPPFFLSVLGAIMIVSLMILFRKRWPAGLAVLVSYLIILAPTAHLVRIGLQSAADRYSYISAMGWWILLAAGVTWCYRRYKSQLLSPIIFKSIAAVGCVILCSLIPLTWHYLGVWKDSNTLWGYAFALDPRCEIAALNLGNLLKKNPDEALRYYRKALELNPNLIEGYGNLANTLVDLGREQEAIPFLEHAMRLDPRNAKIHLAMGYALLETGQLDQAISYLLKSVQLENDLAGGYAYLGMAWEKKGNWERALASFREAVRYMPRLAEAHFNLATILQRLGRNQEALESYRQAIQLNISGPEAYNNLGTILMNQNQLTEASELFEKSLLIDPDFASAHLNLAYTSLLQGQHALAWDHVKRSRKLGVEVPESILAPLREKMPEPQG